MLLLLDLHSFVCSSAGPLAPATEQLSITSRGINWPITLPLLFRGSLKPNEYSYIPTTSKANEWFVNWALCNRTKLNQKLNLNLRFTNRWVNCTSLQPALRRSMSSLANRKLHNDRPPTDTDDSEEINLFCIFFWIICKFAVELLKSSALPFPKVY